MQWFDHNATSPTAPEALAAWNAASAEHWRNPSSPVPAAARTHAFLDALRARVAAIFDERDPGCVVFHSGATEGNNAVIASAARRPGRMLVSAVEHPSVAEPAKQAFGDRLTVIPVDADGVIRLDALAAELLRGDVALVAVMAANNETGVIQPWMRAAELAASHGAKFLCDATQWLGRLPADGLVRLDYVVAGGHKFGAPKGVGLSLVRRCDRVYAGQLGGEQENGRRAGTENVPAAAAFVAALEAANAEMLPMLADRIAWRDAFEDAVVSRIPGTVVNGAGAQRLWNTVSLTPPRHANTRWVLKLERRGFEISTGSACANGSGKSSRVLAAMGRSEEEIRRTVRVSGGRFTGASDWAALADAFVAVSEELDADTSGSSVIIV